MDFTAQRDSALADHNALDGFSRSFMERSLMVVGILCTLFPLFELVVFPQNYISSIISTLGGIGFIATSRFARRYDYSRITTYLIIVAVPLLCYRMLTTTGPSSPLTIWFVYFPLYAALFKSLRAAIAATIYAGLGWLITILITIMNWLPNAEAQFAAYPLSCRIGINIVTVTALAAHLALYVLGRQKLEKLLMDQYLMLVHASRLISIGEMAGSIAHEINTPVCAISLASRSAKQELEKGSEIDLEVLNKHLDLVIRVVDRITKTVATLSNYARKQATSQQVSTPHEIMEDVQELIQDSLGRKGVTFTLESDEGATDRLIIASQEVTQILVILLNNARDAVETYPERWIKVRIVSQPSSVGFEIADSGKGIPESVEKEMYKPFFSTKPEKGTGLGLSVAASLARSVNAQMQYIRGRENTTFLVSCPSLVVNDTESRATAEFKSHG